MSDQTPLSRQTASSLPIDRGFSLRSLLLPLVPLYGAALALREMRLGTRLEPVRKLRFPVISIGNLSTGGAGKTPLTMTLARALAQRGLHVDVLSRGYGRQGKLPVRVNPQGDAEEFGDEPLLIARETGAPVYLAAQRYEAGLLAEADLPAEANLLSDPGSIEGRTPAVHLLDDGFQHRQLARDIDILLLDRGDWKDRLLPAGNLREPVSASRRASVIAIPADDAALEAELRAPGLPGQRWSGPVWSGPVWSGPVWQLRRVMDVPPVDGPVLAFCGIARPAQFFAGLEAAGLTLAGRIPFADHHAYTQGDADRLIAAAAASRAVALVTTEKDRVRLGSRAARMGLPLPVRTASLRTEIEDENGAVDWLLSRLAETGL